MLERWLQVCRVRITFTLLPTNCFVSTTTNSMKCIVNWIPLRIRVRLRNTQPHLKKWISKPFNVCGSGRSKVHHHTQEGATERMDPRPQASCIIEGWDPKHLWNLRILAAREAYFTVVDLQSMSFTVKFVWSATQRQRCDVVLVTNFRMCNINFLLFWKFKMIFFPLSFLVVSETNDSKHFFFPSYWD